KGQLRVLPKAEILGRLYSCGFRLLEYTENECLLTFVAQKIKLPDYNTNPSFGPIFKMKRMGKNGMIIHVYKLRTMHAYSEYLQSYINETNGLAVGGKFKNDFRISSYGRFFRKFWIDELPMLINFIRGDIKLFGVRPISKHYFNLYSEELKQLRIMHKPGLIPPFYVDLPKTLEEIIDSELRYLNAYEKSPILTDIRYFVMVFYTIVIRRARSN
ncbi:MAG: sugar transferase, partial [Vallitaleaceae bacterium]|nr:sugar transferase [Vallitaleaceae bacterium]